MFSLLYYLHILPYPYPFVKHYFQKFLDLFKWCGSTYPPHEFPLIVRNILCYIRA